MQRPVRSGSRAQLLNPLRISHPKIDKLACQAQGVDIFAKGEIPLYDAYCVHFYIAVSCTAYAIIPHKIIFCKI